MVRREQYSVASMSGARYVNDEQALPHMTVIEPWPKLSAEATSEYWVKLEYMQLSIGSQPFM